MRCVSCGFENMPGSPRCLGCGSPLRAAVIAVNLARKIVANSRFQTLELEHHASAPAASVPIREEVDWIQRADQSRRRGEFAQALREFSRAIEDDRMAVNAWAGQVRMLIALTEFPQAHLWARKALEFFHNHADLNAARAQALCRIGQLHQAQAASDAAIRQPGQSIYPWLARGDLMLARKDPLEEHCFNKAAELSGDWLTRIEIAEIHLHYRRFAKALNRCQEAVAKATNQPYPYFLQARCQLAMGITDAARRSLTHCLDLDPLYVRARTTLESIAHRSWLQTLLSQTT